MATNKYNVGDQVWLSRSSRWVYSDSDESYSTNPTHCYGTITDAGGSYSVQWSNGETNGSYQDEDLLPHADVLVTSQPQPEDDLLEEAKRRYPIGTKFKSFEKPGVIRIVTPWRPNLPIVWKVQDGGKTVRSENGIGDQLGCSNPAVYKKGQWAEIVSDSTSSDDLLAEAVRRYPIGTKYIPLSDSGAPFYSGEIKTVKREVRSITAGKLIDCGPGYCYVNGTWAEIISETLITDDILAEARRRFPLGSKYIPICSSGRPYDNTYIVGHEPQFLNEDKDRMDCGVGYCYVNGTWAEVVEEGPYVPSQDEVLARYPKGTWYLPIKDDGTVGSTAFESQGEYKTGANFVWVNSSTVSGYIYDVKRQKWADIAPAPKTDDSRDELLAEARRRFPVGTRYIPIDSHGQKADDPVESVREATWYNRYGIDIGDGFCYYDGTWAEIDYSTPSTPSEPAYIDYSEEQHRREISAKFPPGTVFKPVYGDGTHSDATYVVGADWTIARGIDASSYWFNYPNGGYTHGGYIRISGHEAYIVGHGAVSAKDTDVRSERVKLLPEIEVKRKIVI